MTDEAQEQKEYRRVLEQAEGWSPSYLAATLTDSSAPPVYMLAARHEAARRLRACQQEGDLEPGEKWDVLYMTDMEFHAWVDQVVSRACELERDRIRREEQT